MTEAIVDSVSTAHLRNRLTDELVAKGTIVSNEVEAAFRTVPRHLFAPGARLEESYAQDTVHGTSLSALIEVHPVGTPDDQLPESAFVITKRHTRIVVSWSR